MYVVTESEFNTLTSIVYRWSHDLQSLASGPEAEIKNLLLGSLTMLRGVVTTSENIALTPINLHISSPTKNPMVTELIDDSVVDVNHAGAPMGADIGLEVLPLV